MMERSEPGGGFGVLDGVALVIGAAVASVHIRSVIREGLSIFGWFLVWFTFSWVAVTATGPFLLALRRLVRRQPNYPKVGDRLWGVLGLPWVATALLRSSIPVGEAHRDDFSATALSTGIAIAAFVALVVVWMTWVMVPPDQAARTASAPWTNRVGLILSVAWPVQCGLGLVVNG